VVAAPARDESGLQVGDPGSRTARVRTTSPHIPST